MAGRSKTGVKRNRHARKVQHRRAAHSHHPSSSSTKPKKSPASENSEALYLYGITRAVPSGLKLPEGVDGRSAVEPIACAGLTCWISRVLRPEFADRLSENMENLEWLAAASVRHQRVVGAIAAAADILPARFGTVFLGEAGLETDMRGRKRALLSALARIAGTEEWGVKVFAGTRAPERVVAARSGKEYLQRKATQLHSAAQREPDEQVRDLALELQRVVLDSTPGGKVSGGQRNLEWQASYLLRRSRRRDFQNVLSRFARRWRDSRRIEATGPWPPYSFVSAHGRQR